MKIKSRVISLDIKTPKERQELKIPRKCKTS